jgi:hypothetical protein
MIGAIAKRGANFYQEFQWLQLALSLGPRYWPFKIDVLDIHHGLLPEYLMSYNYFFCVIFVHSLNY